jgi:nitroimidazol reductase NimA-like FMN-containing flavoprotein (pyridoxamine 5'-phosphate oxidase superfamily)
MGAAATDREGLEVLRFQECLELLDTQPVGRIAFVHAGLPVVLPVNHRRDDRTVVFRTAPGSMLDAAMMRHVVAFEVDHYDADARTGWSVVLRGSSDVVTDDDEVARLDRLGLHPWADRADRRDWVRIRPTEVSGRRIVRPD